jgi:ribosomal protein S18 acetylase RimI-like enzyme
MAFSAFAFTPIHHNPADMNPLPAATNKPAPPTDATAQPQAPHIRSAGLNDLPALATLFDAYRQFYDQAPDRDRATAFMQARLTRGDSHVLLALASERGTGSDHSAPTTAIGFCQLYPSWCSVLAAPIVVVYDLFVTPHARQTGAGRALMQAAQAWAQSEGYARMDLTTAKGNLAAQSLYTTLGWQRDEVFLTYTQSLAAAAR